MKIISYGIDLRLVFFFCITLIKISFIYDLLFKSLLSDFEYNTRRNNSINFHRDVHQMLQQVFGYQALAGERTFEWFDCIKGNRESVGNK